MGAKRNASRAVKRKRAVREKPVKSAGVKPLPAGASAVDDTLNPGLQGIDDRNLRYAGRKQEASIEDPLRDWPEDGAADSDDWLLDRDWPRSSPT